MKCAPLRGILQPVDIVQFTVAARFTCAVLRGSAARELTH
jgi:hypothetical protein